MRSVWLSQRGADEAVRLMLERVTADPERVADVLSASTHPLVAFTPGRVIVTANRAAEEFFGYAPGELDGRPTDDLLPERLRQPDAPAMLATADLTTVALPARRRDGSEQPTLWTFGNALGRDGPVFVMLVRDRTTVDEAIEALRPNEEQFRTLADTMPLLAWYADSDGEIRWYNQRWHEYTGTTLANQEGWKWQSVHDPDDLPRVLERWNRALASGEPWEDTFRLRRHDGAMRWFLSRAVPLRDAHGRITRWFGTNVDIDDQKRAEADAALLSDVTSILVSSIDISPMLEAVASRLVPARADSCTITVSRDGEAPELRAFVHREPRRAGLVTVSSIEVPLVATGRTIGTMTLQCDVSKRQLDERDRAFADAVAWRVAAAIDRALLFDLAQRERRTAEEANRAKDEFLAIVSHELRTPLNAMLGWTRLLRSGALPEGQSKRALETIERNASAQAQLINDILDVSRIITGKLRLDVAPVDLHHVIEAAIESVRTAADAKGVRLDAALDPSTFISGDAARLQQVVWNLLTNAIKFTPRGGHVVVHTTSHPAFVEIAVEDSGEGIEPSFLPHVFERFRQQDGSISRAHGGLGLGLSIVRHLVELHGGTVTATSRGRGQGATFVVQLPSAGAISSAHGRSSDAAMKPIECPTGVEGLRVLVVDDEPDARDLIAAMLEGCKLRVETVQSAGEALAALDHTSFDVIVSDIGMPGEDGYALIERVRARPPDRGGRTPAIALTAYARLEDRRRALLAGYQMHVSKPVEPTELLFVLASLTGRQRSVHA